MKRKIISLILAIATVISLIPTNIFVFSTDDAASAEYGDVLASFKDATAVVYADTTYEAEPIGADGTAFGDNGTFRIVEYYEASEIVRGYSESVRRYRIHSDDVPEQYAGYVWVDAADLTNIHQDDILEDTTLRGKKIRVIGHYDNYDDTFAASFHLDPIGELHDDGASYWAEWTTEDEAVIFTIEDVYKTPWGTWYYVTTDNEDYQEFFSELWIDAADVVFVEEDEEILIEGQVGITQGGEELTEITIARGQKEYVFTELDENLGKAVSYQWQILIDAENDRWANIYDGIYSYATISAALVINMLDNENQVKLRCIVTKSGLKYVSGELVVTLSDYEKTIEDEEDVPVLDTVALDESINQDKFEVTVEYKFLHQNNLEVMTNKTGLYAPPEPFVRTLKTGLGYSGTATSPYVMGYMPYREISQETYEEKYAENPDAYLAYTAADNKVYYLESAPTEVFTNVFADSDEDIRDRIVYYIPQTVNYRVNYYEQNVYDDEYTSIGSVSKNGLAHELVNQELGVWGKDTFANIPEHGFVLLGYDVEQTIEPDNSTTVNIYYDREYYLVDFELGEDGYGVTPLYVRYGYKVTLGTPKRPGYTFNGWNLTEVTINNADGTETNVDTTQWPAKYRVTAGGSSFDIEHHNLVYTANWAVAKSAYTIAYWLENADSTDATNKDNYSVWYAVKQEVNTGSNTVAGGDHILTYVTDYAAKTTINELKPFLDYVVINGASSTTAQKVSGEGTTIVNVYYKRKSYNLRFYYAISSGTGSNIKYYVIGGTTERFANNGGSNNLTNELARLDHYFTTSNDEQAKAAVGQVTSLPTVDPKYTPKSLNYNSRKYHYFEFSAKYGADISSLWPCDVLSSVTTSSENQWGKTATASGWTGEYYVKYNINPNKTIKGKYQVLDTNLLWNNNGTYADDTNTVSFLCFWENGAKVGWSIPELYRYKIWLPCLDGVAYPETKTYHDITVAAKMTYNGQAYYLADSYDTCDDSAVGSQTQPALMGYKSIGRESFGIYKNPTTGDGTGASTINLDHAVLADEITQIKNMSGWDEGNNKRKYASSCVVHFFYERKTYELSYSDNAGGPDDLEKIPYGTNLNVEMYTKSDGPTYPNNFEANENEFAGWYLDEQCTIPFYFSTTDSNGNVVNTTMPAKNFTLYAKWVPTYWDVEVYLDENAAAPIATHNNVRFGGSISEPTKSLNDAKNEAPYKDMRWVGWFYRDADNNELPYHFDAMTIKQDYLKSEGTHIYGKWSDKIPVEYTIKYQIAVVENGETKYIDIAHETRGSEFVGRQKTVYPKTNLELFEGYQVGYFPKVRSHQMTIERSSDSDSANVYTFLYTKADVKVPYTVKHTFVSDDFKEVLGTNTFTYECESDDSEHAKVGVYFYENVTEEHVIKELKVQKPNLTPEQLKQIWHIVTTLSPDAYYKELILEYATTEDEAKTKNVLEFHWRLRGDTTIYEVIHYTQPLYPIGTTPPTPETVEYEVYHVERYEVELDPDSSKNQKTATPITINGFVDNPEYSQPIGTATALEYKDGGYTGYLVLKIYYDRKPLTYTVKHYFQNAQNSFEADTTLTKTIENAYFGAVVTEEAVEKDGYSPDKTSQRQTITQDGQVIEFYYTPMIVNIYYAVYQNEGGNVNPSNEVFSMNLAQPAGAVPDAFDGYKFEGWYKDSSCTIPITISDGKVDDDGHLYPKKPSGVTNGMNIYYYAKFVPTISSLTIQNQGVAAYEADQAMIYQVVGSGYDGTPVSMIVTVIGNGSVTIDNLPIGSYTVSEQGDWSWRYAAPKDSKDSTQDGSGTIVLQEDADENIILFTYSTPNTQWLSDNDYAEN